MAWKIEFARSAAMEFEALDRTVQQRIRNFLRRRVAVAENPRMLGKALTGEWKGLWRFRVGDYRLICDVEDDRVVVVVVKVGHRRRVYG